MENIGITTLAIDIAIKSENLKPVVAAVGVASREGSIKNAIKTIGTFNDVAITCSGLVGKATLAFQSFGEIDFDLTNEDEIKEESIDYNVKKNKPKWMR